MGSLGDLTGWGGSGKLTPPIPPYTGHPTGHNIGSPTAGNPRFPGSMGTPISFGTRNDLLGGYLGYVEYSHLDKLGGMWKGQNGLWYSLDWGGNGWTGARSLSERIANGAHYAGYASLVFSLSVEGYSAYNAYEAGNWAGVGQSGANMFFSGVMTLGGPPGLAIGGIYFLIQDTVGWGSVMSSYTQFIQENPGWNPYGGYGGP